METRFLRVVHLFGVPVFFLHTVARRIPALRSTLHLKLRGIYLNRFLIVCLATPPAVRRYLGSLHTLPSSSWRCQRLPVPTVLPPGQPFLPWSPLPKSLRTSPRCAIAIHGQEALKDAGPATRIARSTLVRVSPGWASRPPYPFETCLGSEEVRRIIGNA